jgi:hypothetical protein
MVSSSSTNIVVEHALKTAETPRQGAVSANRNSDSPAPSTWNRNLLFGRGFLENVSLVEWIARPKELFLAKISSRRKIEQKYRCLNG